MKKECAQAGGIDAHSREDIRRTLISVYTCAIHRRLPLNFLEAMYRAA